MLYSYVLGGVILSNTKEVLSLFSSAGIGELGIEEAGLSILVNNELILDRCKIYKENYPNVTTICGDIWLNEDKIIESWNINMFHKMLIFHDFLFCVECIYTNREEHEKW